jgi:pantetheine-phosphate adenylyltransferase
MIPSVETTFISSSIVREIATHGGSLEGLVHPAVASALKQRYGASGETK